MNNQSSAIVQRLWNYCTVLRDDGLSYGDYVEQLTYLALKQNPLARAALDEFVTCFNPANRHEREATWSSSA